MADAKSTDTGITKLEEGLREVTYVGTAAAFISAGVLQPEQIPGMPGMGRMMCTFYDGKRVKRGQNTRRDERWMQVRCTGTSLTVSVGLSIAEAERRVDVWLAQQEREPAAQQAYRADPGTAMADIRQLPTAAKEPVVNQRHRGSYGKKVASFGSARRRREQASPKHKEKTQEIERQVSGPREQFSIGPGLREQLRIYLLPEVSALLEKFNTGEMSGLLVSWRDRNGTWTGRALGVSNDEAVTATLQMALEWNKLR